MDLDLTIDGLRDQTALAVVDGHTGLVAGRLNPEDTSHDSVGQAAHRCMGTGVPGRSEAKLPRGGGDGSAFILDLATPLQTGKYGQA
jgi:hypothetical protein